MGVTTLAGAIGFFIAWGANHDSFAILLAMFARRELWIAWLLSMVFVTILLPIINQAIMPIYARRFFKQMKSFHAPLHVSWSGGNYIVESGDSRAVIPFANFHYWRECRRAFLLYQSDRLFNFVMKRAFASEDQLASLRAELKSYSVHDVSKRRPDCWHLI
ncbi:MAG: YcxB family protein [Desulfobulbaceae bacterium]|jgi:hypothetical protein|nr:YcxB family protein [Desulfobulbaceae bacterium]